MISFLSTTWSKYKALAWWKKALLLLPLLLLAAICVALFIIGFGRGDRLSQHVKYHKTQVDEKIKANNEREAALEKKQKKVATEQEVIKKQIDNNIKEATELTKEVEKAVERNDLKKLEQLRRQINEM